MWGSPDFQFAAGDSSGAERSGVSSFVISIKQTSWVLGESHTTSGAHDRVGRGGVCVMFLVIVALSPSTFTRQQQTDMKMEQLLDATALFLRDTPQPFLLHSLRGNMTRRDACTD